LPLLAAAATQSMVSPSADYQTLEVRYQARLPFTKHLSLKPHSSRKDDLPAGRTLFVAGIPVIISANDLVELFSAFGDVSSLAVHPSKVGMPVHSLACMTGCAVCCACMMVVGSMRCRQALTAAILASADHLHLGFRSGGGLQGGALGSCQPNRA
jgi:hypothetical protein